MRLIETFTCNKEYVLKGLKLAKCHSTLQNCNMQSIEEFTLLFVLAFLTTCRQECFKAWISLFCLFFLLFVFYRQGLFSLWPWLFQNRADLLPQRPSCLCFPSAGLKCASLPPGLVIYFLKVMVLGIYLLFVPAVRC